MRNRFTISIADTHGAIHYDLHQIFKQIFKYTILGVVILILAAVIAIIILQKNINRLEAKRDMIFNRLTDTMRQNGVLAQDINAKLHEFNELESRIGFFEALTGVQSTPGISLVDRIELASLAISRREQEYKELGDRLDHLEDVIGVEADDGSKLAQRVDVAGLNFAQKTFLLDNIPSGLPLLKLNGISSGFGERDHPLLKRKEYHAGMDLRADTGTRVYATCMGVVEFAGFHSGSGFGNMVIIRHNLGFYTLYGHLSKVLVETGDFINRGVNIALSGSTGLSSGPHLHYELRYLHSSLNPEPFMAWDMNNYQTVFKEKQVKWDSLLKLVNLKLTNQPSPLSPAAPP